MNAQWKRKTFLGVLTVLSYFLVRASSYKRENDNYIQHGHNDQEALDTHDHQEHYHHDYDKHHKYQPYGFGYEVEDGWGNSQYRHEKSSDPWKVKGSYGYKDAWGIYRHVDYVADKYGFRAHIKTNEPGTAPRDPAAVKMNSHPSPAGHPKKLHHGYKDDVHADNSKTSYTYASKSDQKVDYQS